MLYDLKADPNEFNNLMDDPAYVHVAERLKRELSELLNEN
jgi:hypothetical protein